MNAMDRIAAALAAPKTHVVLATYESGRVYHFETRCAASAESHAIGWRRKIGRELISRESGELVKVLAVEVLTRADWRAKLAAEYVALVGYDIFEDDKAATESEVADLLAELRELHKESAE